VPTAGDRRPDPQTVKGVEELIDQFNSSTATAGFLSVVVALCYFVTVYGLELLPGLSYFTPTIRKLLADYAFPVGVASCF